mmetsp:Transcript_144/g.435  ORF Transcript_144/g.435 Transcript_144/m.435 type:complete len:144 (+) Transcript_144:91-522(+)
MTPTPGAVSVIANPLADDKLTPKVLKVVKKAAKAKMVRRGVKEVVKALRKDVKGLCVIAGDISPIDVITHLPILCEDNSVPYIYVPSKEELGAANQTKRPTSCVLVLPKPGKGSSPMDDEKQAEYKESYDKVVASVKKATPVF